MPNIKSAEKRALVSERRNQENRAIISKMKTAVKRYNNAIDTNNIEEAERLLPLTVSIVDSTASKGMIHKNKASNIISALSKKLSDVKSGKVVIVVKKDNKTIAAEKAKAAKEVRDTIRQEIVRKKEEAAQAKAKALEEKIAAEKAAKKASKTKAIKADKPEVEEAPKPAKKRAPKKAATEKDSDETTISE